VKKQTVVTQESFNRLLDWLHTEREMAAIRYEEIRLRLIKIFLRRGSNCPEEMADETINRVTGKIDVVASTYQGDPALYFYGVAQNVFKESLKKRTVPLPEQMPAPIQESNKHYECLESCIERLPPEARWLILQYYLEDKQAKIDHRKALANLLGVTPHSLTMRAHRIKARLKICIENCIKGVKED
jgi:DNA-directed RNA polymerase specialized sigma24 family protein